MWAFVDSEKVSESQSRDSAPKIPWIPSKSNRQPYRVHGIDIKCYTAYAQLRVAALWHKTRTFASSYSFRASSKAIPVHRHSHTIRRNLQRFGNRECMKNAPDPMIVGQNHLNDFQSMKAGGTAALRLLRHVRHASRQALNAAL